MLRIWIACAAAAGLAVPAQDELEENREYKAWAAEKPGAWVKWKVETQTGAMKVQTELTATLVKVTGEHAVLEEKTKVSIGDDAREHTKSREIPAKLRKGTTGEGDKFEIVKEGNEEIEIKGRALACHWIEMKLTDRRGASVKAWLAAEVVGGCARQVIKHDEAGKMGLTMTVVDWNRPK
jgi:hypothetical protein